MTFWSSTKRPEQELSGRFVKRTLPREEACLAVQGAEKACREGEKRYTETDGIGKTVCRPGLLLRGTGGEKLPDFLWQEKRETV